MKSQSFSLVLAGVSEITDELANALFEAVDGEIEFEMRSGVASLGVRRKANSLRDAILASIRQVEAADVGVRVIRVESDAANTIAKINAELLSVA
jgi:hypothetical protein